MRFFFFQLAMVRVGGGAADCTVPVSEVRALLDWSISRSPVRFAMMFVELVNIEHVPF